MTDAALLRRVWRWARPAAGAAVLAALLVRLGTGPFLHGLRSLDAPTVALAVAVTALTTVCCARRWRLVAAALGDDALRPGTAVAAYYRSQLLNATLPGGVLGDVHRGVRHGRETRAVGRGLRAVAWERALGQLVQVLLAAVVLLAVPSPLRSPLAVPLVVAVVGAALAAAWWSGSPLAADLRALLHEPRTVLAVAGLSGAAVAGHVAVFALALHGVGARLPAGQALPLALVVLVAASVPTNLAGWGPREGAAAWAFGATRLDPAQGVAVAAAYGVMALAATLPGGVVLLLARDRARHRPVGSGVAHG